MQLPSISQYAESIGNSIGRTRTLGSFEPQRDVYDKVVVRAGNNAVVFRVNSDCLPSDKRSQGASCQRDCRDLMLKCYIKPSSGLDTIYDFVNNTPDTLFTPARLLKEELYVYDVFGQGRYYDIVVAGWVEGNTLETEIRRAWKEHGTERFARLADSFDRMACQLLRRPWAHGDLKPENIVVRPDDSMVLIDYDAMYIPGLDQNSVGEIGTPGYQHPLRMKGRIYDKTVDDYPVALISASLHSLASNPELFGKFNRSDIILAHPDEIIDGSSEAYGAMLKALAAAGNYTIYEVALRLTSGSVGIPALAEMLERTAAKIPDDQADLSLFCEGELWGYADSNGMCVIPPIFSDASEFSEGLAVVTLQGRVQVIDSAGAVIIDNSMERIKPFSESMAAVRLDGRWGYIDRQGEIVIEPVFEAASSLHEGRAAVKVGDRWGYIDRTGQIVIQPVWEHARGFRSGRAVTYKDGLVFHLDYSGSILDEASEK